nr:unnamed protein product [Digitaria exilis]
MEHTDQDGWTQGCYHNRPGFTRVLWQILQEKGFEEPPLYIWKQFDTLQQVGCTVYVHIPESETHATWKLDETQVEGFEFEDTVQTAALAALTELCQKNKFEIGTSSARFFPLQDPEDGVWKRRVKALKNKSRVENDEVAASSVDYMVSMFSLLQICQKSYQRQREKNTDFKMKMLGIKSGLEEAQQAMLDREHEMERSMRDMARRMDEKDAEIQHLQEVGAESAAARTEAMGVHTQEMQARVSMLQDEIVALRTALEQYEHLVAAADHHVEAPPAPAQDQPPAQEGAGEEVDIVGMDPALAAPPAPEDAQFADEVLEGFEGFEFEVEEHNEALPEDPNAFAWANANVDGFDPEGHGPLEFHPVVVDEDSDEEDPSEIQGESGMTTVTSSSSSSTSSSASSAVRSDGSENSVNQPAPMEGGA